MSHTAVSFAESFADLHTFSAIAKSQSQLLICSEQQVFNSADFTLIYTFKRFPEKLLQQRKVKLQKNLAKHSYGMVLFPSYLLKEKR